MPQDYPGYSWFGNPLVVYATDWIVLVFCVLTACSCEHPSGSAPRCACGNGGPFFRGCSTGHLPRTTLDRSCLDVPALSSVKRPIFLCCFSVVDTSTRRSGFHFPGNVPSSTCGQPGLHESHSRLCLGCCGVPCLLGCISLLASKQPYMTTSPSVGGQA